MCLGSFCSKTMLFTTRERLGARECCSGALGPATALEIAARACFGDDKALQVAASGHSKRLLASPSVPRGCSNGPSDFPQSRYAPEMAASGVPRSPWVLEMATCACIGAPRALNSKMRSKLCSIQFESAFEKAFGKTLRKNVLGTPALCIT